jgi:hypothetical protein
MSLYLKSENQELLWRTIHKTPLIDNYFRAYAPGSRERWFQDVVKSFSIRNPTIANQEALARVNRDTIAYMVSELKAEAPSQPPQQHPTPPQSNPQTIPIGNEYREPTTIYSRSNANKDEFADKFTSRQKEYESMLQKPAVPDIKFSEKLEDGVIQNMDELIQQQIKQRELDIANYSPLPPVGVAPPSMGIAPSHTGLLGSRKISIGEDIQNIESISLPPQKKVTFESTENNLYDTLLSQIRELTAELNKYKSQSEVLDARIQSLESMIGSHKKENGIEKENGMEE